MNFLRSIAAAMALALAVLAPAPSHAGLTNIAQVPLLNITGTGSVKPNIMLLYDNSGSMDQAYTPDYINDALCRKKATLASATPIGCDVGHPPFMSNDFNKQYYNPDLRYAPPIKADGTYYNEQTAANTVNWTSVTADGFSSRKLDMYGNTNNTNINLTNGFPDLKWCDPANAASCQKNLTGYLYPDNTYNTASAFLGNPYYYRIRVAEYCTDESMTNCQSVGVGGAAPSGYATAVKVRWCNSVLLTNCQGKRVGSYIYPKYSTAAGAGVSFGTIAIGASNTATSMTISSATIPDPSTARTVTNGTITAGTGTNTALKQQTTASALAASIIAKSNTTQYWACVRTPVGQVTVQPCSDFGISLGADNIVAVMSIVCSGSKSLANCAMVTDNSRAGWAITVTAPTVTVTPAVSAVAKVPTTAVLTVSGTSANSNPTPSLASVTWNGTTLASAISIGKNVGSTSAVTVIKTAINNAAIAGITAYTGGNAVTPTCAAKNSSSLCVVNTTPNANVGAFAVGTMTNAGTMSFAAAGGAGYVAAVAAAPAVTDAIPVTTGNIAAGSAPPDVFQRVDIVPATTSYAKTAARTDCTTTAGVCSYAEEMTNFANWYSYYKTRQQMMKTSVGFAFSPLTSNYRVGYVRLSQAGVGGAIDMVPADFSATNRTTFYSNLYGSVTSGSTPNRTAMDYVGKMFSNLAPYAYTAGNEVVQYPCQQNFTILVTDGYWNGGAPAIANNDTTENAARFCTQARGCVDTRVQASPSLADVALYWYNGGSATGTVSLRPALEPDMSRPGVVPAAAGDNTHLHVNTYTLGLGMDGVMTYEPNYDTTPRVGGDFYNIITGATSGCPWNSNGAYVWPDPDVSNAGNTVQERVDDMWHAAVNGHGKYFSAQDPQEVVDGLSSAIANMQVRVGAAAAAATSTPNISQQDNDIFSDTFTTVRWYGELSDKKIDITTGVVGATAVWNSSDSLGAKVAATTDTRTLYMLDTSGAPAFKSFSYAAMSATEKAWFDNKCTSLSQCTLLSAGDKAIVNDGNNLVNWLRGQQSYSDDSIFRAYSQTSYTPSGQAGPLPIVLGDIASSKPAFMRDSRKSYSTSGYTDFKVATAGRAPTVFTAANDGMLHAFNATTGEELWGYLPRITMKKLYLQASTTYGTNHQYTTDGSPELGDVQIGGAWKTVMVAGLNGGGRGFYALDVTNPSAPAPLWELCADSSICTKHDDDIGLTFGNPQFGYWNNKWVVYLTSGYNNVSGVDGVATGSGIGYLYVVDVADGTILKKISTGAGSAATPSGFAKITAISANPFTDPVTTYIYGGDNLGKMWRFDLTGGAGVITVLSMGDAGATQPITTRPEVTQCASTVTAPDGSTTAIAQRAVLYGTGRLLDVPDTSNTDTQSVYMVKDIGSTIALRGVSMVRQTLTLLGVSSNVNTYTITNNPVDLSNKDGWYFDLNLNPGERVNLDPKVVGGGINVVTNTPSSSSACSVGGSSNVYQVNACTGSYVAADTIAGATLSNTSAAVGFIIIRLPSGALKMITTTASGATITTGVNPPSSAASRKVGWRRVKGRPED